MLAVTYSLTKIWKSTRQEYTRPVAWLSLVDNLTAAPTGMFCHLNAYVYYTYHQHYPSHPAITPCHYISNYKYNHTHHHTHPPHSPTHHTHPSHPIITTNHYSQSLHSTIAISNYIYNPSHHHTHHHTPHHPHHPSHPSHYIKPLHQAIVSCHFTN